MRWNLRLKAAEAGIWRSTDMRRLLAAQGLEISAGKMSMLWSRTPTTIRLDDLEVICRVLGCTPSDVMVMEQATAQRSDHDASRVATGTDDAPIETPWTAPVARLGRTRTRPPL